MSEKEIAQIIRDGFSINDVCIKLYGYCNGRTQKKLNKLIVDKNIDISHFRTKNKNKKYDTVVRTCPVCDKKFHVVENQNKKTCSLSCANRHFRNIKSHSERSKISQSLVRFHSNQKIKAVRQRTCAACGSIFKVQKLASKGYSRAKTCSTECRNELLKKLTETRILSGKHKGWQSRNIESYPEKFFKRVLENNAIPYEFNKVVKKRDLSLDVSGNYFLDFYLPECNIDLEIDGKQHSYADRSESDKIRDEIISQFYTIYRIKWKTLNTENGKVYMKEQIDAFLNFYNEVLSTKLSKVK